MSGFEVGKKVVALCNLYMIKFANENIIKGKAYLITDLMEGLCEHNPFLLKLEGVEFYKPMHYELLCDECRAIEKMLPVDGLYISSRYFAPLEDDAIDNILEEALRQAETAAPVKVKPVRRLEPVGLAYSADLKLNHV